MDFPADFGLGERNPPSDHPTPSTLNSSSNTSYAISGFDDPSPDRNPQKTTAGQSKQGLGTVFDKNQPVHISPQAQGGQSYPTNTTGPLTAGSGSAFNMPSVWDMPTPSADISNVDFGGVNVDGLSDAQWAQILSSSGNAAGWDSWRPS
ncbi:Transcription factor [Penicillium chermesinum]|nr:Transcription factor [Penicillium chermesinum]